MTVMPAVLRATRTVRERSGMTSSMWTSGRAVPANATSLAIGCDRSRKFLLSRCPGRHPVFMAGIAPRAACRRIGWLLRYRAEDIRCTAEIASPRPLTKDQTFSSMLHGEALLRAKRPELERVHPHLRQARAVSVLRSFGYLIGSSKCRFLSRLTIQLGRLCAIGKLWEHRIRINNQPEIRFIVCHAPGDSGNPSPFVGCRDPYPWTP
jgi:hypothetical protein